VLRQAVPATATPSISSAPGCAKLSRVSEPPAGMVLYRGNGGMALPSGFLEPDEQVCVCVHACVRALVREGP